VKGNKTYERLPKFCQCVWASCECAYHCQSELHVRHRNIFRVRSRVTVIWIRKVETLRPARGPRSIRWLQVTASPENLYMECRRYLTHIRVILELCMRASIIRPMRWFPLAGHWGEYYNCANNDSEFGQARGLPQNTLTEWSWHGHNATE
jgi:hypothetical protein